MKNKTSVIFVAIIVLSFFGYFAIGNSFADDTNKRDFQEGDILLQHLTSNLGKLIQSVTKSTYTHCGMVVKEGNKLYVIEAVGPVKYTSIENWINKGHNKYFAQIRPVGLTKDQIDKVVKESKKYLGKPYDIQYELDDKKIYCSELIYKAYLKAADIEIGKKVPLGNMNWRPNVVFIKMITGGELPLDREIVTPVSLVKSKNVKMIYSNFPEAKNDE